VGILATAVVLRELALRRAGELPSGDIGAWREVLGDYAALHDAETRAGYADDVLGVLRVGLEAEAIDGEVVLLPSREVSAPEGAGVARAYLSEYDGAHWVQAGDGHWRAGRSGHSITHIIIHTMQGSYSGSIGWFRDPSNPYDTSTHYLIRSSDGDITQMVEEADTAHHIGGWNPWTIGIEHEGYIDNPGRWYTDAMYRSSARLVAHLCAKYDIPIDREHILGHVEVPGASHTDPGPGWDWNRYLTLVREAGAPAGPRYAASFAAIAEAPTEMVSGDDGVVRIDFRNDGSASWSLERTRLGTSGPRDRESPFYADYNWIDARRPTATDAVYASGATGRFSFVVIAPEVTEVTELVETYQLVEEGIEWFGPEVELRIVVRPRAGAVPDPDPGDATVSLPPVEIEPGAAAPPSSSDGAPGRGTVSGGCNAVGGGSGASGPGLGALVIAVVALRGRRRARA
nr:N-acetylmuramoyl-L-alanine amidase [Myxococcota bacterium]